MSQNSYSLPPELPIHKAQGFEYVEQGEGSILLLLHGLFGALSNWEPTLSYFSKSYRVVIPLLPVYKITNVTPSVTGLADYVAEFVAYKQLQNLTLIGNSLGGHIAMVYALRNPNKVRAMILTGSSGLFETGMGLGYIPRSDRRFIKERVEYTFYSAHTATPALIDEVYSIVNDRTKAMRVLKIARAAQRQNLRSELPNLKTPTCLIWGLNDNITPTYVAHEFYTLLPNAELHFIDHCGHAAMMEQPTRFNYLVSRYLTTLQPTSSV